MLRTARALLAERLLSGAGYSPAFRRFLQLTQREIVFFRFIDDENFACDYLM